MPVMMHFAEEKPTLFTGLTDIEKDRGDPNAEVQVKFYQHTSSAGDLYTHGIRCGWGGRHMYPSGST